MFLDLFFMFAGGFWAKRTLPYSITLYTHTRFEDAARVESHVLVFGATDIRTKRQGDVEDEKRTF